MIKKYNALAFVGKIGLGRSCQSVTSTVNRAAAVNASPGQRTLMQETNQSCLMGETIFCMDGGDHASDLQDASLHPLLQDKNRCFNYPRPHKRRFAFVLTIIYIMQGGKSQTARS